MSKFSSKSKLPFWSSEFLKASRKTSIFAPPDHMVDGYTLVFPAEKVSLYIFGGDYVRDTSSLDSYQAQNEYSISSSEFSGYNES